MNSEKNIIKIQGKIEIAEEDFYDNDKPYIELTTRLCYLDYANLNGISLSSKADEECFASIVDMPIVAKMNLFENGFKGHEVSLNNDGTLNFGTSMYGTNFEYYIKDDEVDIPNVGIKTVPCYFAKSKVFKRFPKVIKIIKNYMEGDGLYSSWELSGIEYNEEKGYKEYTKFRMLANALIGVEPAYGKNSKTLQVASKEDIFEKELSEALKQDIINISKNNENNKGNKGGCKMSEKNNEQSALNTTDLYRKLWDVLNPKGWDSNPFYSIWELYPNECKVICRDYSSESEDELIVFSYSIDNEDNITLGEKKIRKLSELLSEKMNVNISMNLDDTAKLLSQKEITIKDLESQISEKDSELKKEEEDKEKVQSELSEKVESITKLGEKVTELEKQVSELTPFKDEHDKSQAEKEAQELSEKQNKLKEYATKGDYITKEELESSEEIKKMIDEVDEKGIKALIAERVIKKLETSTEDNETNTETSTLKKDLNNIDDTIEVSAIETFKSVFK